MGKTVPAYRWALEDEIAAWKGFRKALPSDEDREAFDDLMDICRNTAMAAGNACNPIIFEPMAMSMLLGLQLEFRKLEHKLNNLIWQKICTQKNNQPDLSTPQNSCLNQTNKEPEP